MSKHEMALRRLRSKPKDFTWPELVSLMLALGFELEKGPGPSRKFILPATDGTLYIHEPHPTKLLKPYQVKAALVILKKEGFLS